VTTLLDAVTKAAAVSNWEAVRGAATNEASTREVVLLATAALHAAPARARLALESSEALNARFAGDDEVLDAVLVVSRDVLTLGLTAYTDHGEAALRLLRRAVGRDFSGVHRNAGLVAVSAGVLSAAEVLELVEVKHLRDVGGLGDALTACWVERAEELLGDDPGAWEAFSTLAEGFTGSVEDLLGAVLALA
jgi:hypothetical protein